LNPQPVELEPPSTTTTTKQETVPVVFWQTPRKKLLLVILGVKFASLALIICAVQFFPSFDLNQYHNVIHWPRTGPPTLATHFATWDGAYYLFLSEAGYKKDSPFCAFYPLWPWMIRVFSWLTFDNHFIAGLLLSNILSLAAFLLFHYFVQIHHGPHTANRAVTLLLAYPGAIFFSFIYTESLFLLLIVAFFLFLFRENYGGVALIGFLLPLTKAVGIFCIVPLLYRLLMRKSRPTAYLSLYGPVFGYITYFLFMYYATGNPFEGFEAQRFYPNQPSISHIFNIPGTLRALFMPLHLHGMLDSAIDRALFLVLLYSLFPLFRLNGAYFVYAAFVGVIPALSSLFLSYTRNLMMCFPLFILFAEFFQKGERQFAFRYTLLALGALQIWFLLRFVNFIWAA
jgi:hypothetical protein